MCTIFKVENDEILVAKNHDIFINNGIINSNVRGTRRFSCTFPENRQFHWVSKYGSITFAQCGKESPVHGMNEKGLVVEQATLLETLYPEEDNRYEMSCFEVIQYLLDTCATIREAVHAAYQIRISRNSWPIHFYICDKAGDSAVIEFIGGTLVRYQNEEIRVPVLTNTPYETHLYNDDVSSVTSDDYRRNSTERFNKAKNRIFHSKPKSVNECFELLKEVKREDTAWSVVYNLTKEMIHFESNCLSKTAVISFKDFDFSHHSTAQICEIEEIEENGLKFYYSSKEINSKNIHRFFSNNTIQSVMGITNPEEIINAVSAHANSIIELNTPQRV